MPADRLVKHFARRMLPIAVATGLLIALVPPFAYQLAAQSQLRIQAGIYANHLALAIRAAAEQQPYLWRYNTGKLISATSHHRRQTDIGAVTIEDPAGYVLFTPADLGLGTGVTGGPSGVAPVRVGSRDVARVRVEMDPASTGPVTLAIAGFFAVLGALAGLLLYLYPSRVIRGQADELSRAVDQLQEADKRLKEANADLAARVEAAVGEVRRLSERVVEIQEDERQRIARDLHDGVGQVATALQISLQLARSRPARVESHLDDAGRLSDELHAELRRAVYELRPPALREMPFEQAVRASVEDFELRTGAPASLRVQGDISAIPEQVGLGLYRILQELLTNVSRHAEAAEVGVVVSRVEGELLLTVSDDGRGFDVDAAHPGAGLRGIRERAAFLGGRAEMESAAGEGTVIRCIIPLELAAKASDEQDPGS